MDYFLSLIIGFVASFIGFLAPSMLNMTAVSISIERGNKSGVQFAAGAASVIFIQGFIAVTFVRHLTANPEIIAKLRIVAIFILVTLSIFFFIKARKKFKVKRKKKKGSIYVVGLGMSSFNMLAIPFYLTMATLAETKGWMKIERPFSIIYVIGAVFGAFSLCFI